MYVLLYTIHTLLCWVGFRVWYDENDMAYDLQRSMRQGIERSSVVLACINKTYEQRPNCVFELQEAVKANKPIITLNIEKEGPFAWAGKNTTHGDLMELCSLKTKFFVDIGALACRPDWTTDQDTLDDSSPLFEELRLVLEPLSKILHDINCLPSLGIKLGSSEVFDP